MPILSKSLHYLNGSLPFPLPLTFTGPVFTFKKHQIPTDNKEHTAKLIERIKVDEYNVTTEVEGTAYQVALPGNKDMTIQVEYLAELMKTATEAIGVATVNIDDLSYKIKVALQDQVIQEFEVIDFFYLENRESTATHNIPNYEWLYLNKAVYSELVDTLNLGILGNWIFIMLIYAVRENENTYFIDPSVYQEQLSSMINTVYARAYAQYGDRSKEMLEAVLKRVRAALKKFDLNRLLDFPIDVPEQFKGLQVGGTFTINTDKAIPASTLDFYKLSINYSNGQEAKVKLFDWSGQATEPDISNLPVPFHFNLQENVADPLTVTVKGYDGSVLWLKNFAPSDEALEDINIRVQLLSPGTINNNNNNGTNTAQKKLRGQVISTASAKADVKDLTVLIQAKKQGDTRYRIVGSAQTDNGGYFSLSYPYGQYTEAQAIISTLPDDATSIPIEPQENPEETIADDFLYLLINGVLPDDHEHDDEEDCSCHSTPKTHRLPDQADLINSDEYTQDIGSSCMSLTTPNRTLREYSYHAIVRISDPDVANYVLEKKGTGNGNFEFKLSGGKSLIQRQAIGLDNPIMWQDVPDARENLSFYQSVSIATGHILHYKSKFKADGYSLGELLYSLPLAPGQKKQIVVFDSGRSLTGAESQSLTQSERLSADLLNDRSITDQLSGLINESMSGSSSAETSGVSAGLGASASYGPFGASLGVAGGYSNSNSSASQNSGRNISQSFGERLRQTIMQNAESYRGMNASVVTTVREGQNYAASTEVISNHNHCHGLTMMYFEVLRHYAIYQELVGAEECVFVPFLMTNFSKENIFKWKDVLAANLLPIHSNTYLQPFKLLLRGRQHPLIKAFDANDRIRTNYEHVDYPNGMYANERITEIKGQMQLRIHIPRPKTRFDRILSFPVIKTTVTSQGGVDIAGTIKTNIMDSVVGAVVPCAAKGPSIKYETNSTEVLTRKAIFDMFMTLDANFETVPPAQCIRVNFNGPIDLFSNFLPLLFHGDATPTPMDFFAGMETERALWTAYAKILGMSLNELFQYFNGNVVADWDRIFRENIAPLIADKLIRDNCFSFHPLGQLDLTPQGRYSGGERLMTVTLAGSTSLKRSEITQLKINYSLPGGLSNNEREAFFNFITLNLETIDLQYSTNFSSNVLSRRTLRNDLRDNIPQFPTPLNSEEKRNPRKEDLYLVRQLIEHLNSNMEHYNKVLWKNLDEDRRYMLLDGFNIQIFNEYGNPVAYRSLASVVKNQMMGIAGNALVFPVAAGYRVSQSYIIEPGADEANILTGDELLKQYEPITPMEPYRISVPTKGVYLETVQSACNACEKVYPNSSQDWDKFRTDEPTGFMPITTPTPTVTDWKAAFKDFANPMINIQNAPATPEPAAGLAGLSELLGKSGVFTDITGLQGNQQNAIKTYLSNNENAKAFAEMAKGLAMQQHNTENANTIAQSLDNARESGAISTDQHQALTRQHLEQQIDGGENRRTQAATEREQNRPSLSEAAVEAASEGRNVSAQRIDPDGSTESLVIGSGTTEDSTTRIALLNSSADLRAFEPAANAKTGVINMGINVAGIPNPTILWENIAGTNVNFGTANAATTNIIGLVPGIHQVKVNATSNGVSPTVSRHINFTISVPQFVRITEDSAAFDAALDKYHVAHLKNAIVAEMRDTCNNILRQANVRTIWQLGGLNETMPTHLAANMITAVTIKNMDAARPTLLGICGLGGLGYGPTVYNDIIEIYPGAYATTTGGTLELDTQTIALINELENATTSNPAMDTLAIKMMGRLIGETTAHEILHSLLGAISPDGHNSPFIPGDILNRGAERTFTQRTGMVNTVMTSPMDPNDFNDNGLDTIDRLQTANQNRMNTLFPVNPA
ncbi:MAG: hypothetical protein EOP54_06750 [Sphingobacteriales bacterium]|nr:MAG: hypothetical protein EOP54_06750 [Sphingobacteriales bacterium]